MPWGGGGDVFARGKVAVVVGVDELLFVVGGGAGAAIEVAGGRLDGVGAVVADGEAVAALARTLGGGGDALKGQVDAGGSR